MTKVKKEKSTGITLISFIITVIVMLILAGVAISLTIGDNGIFKKSEQSVGIHNKSEAIEKINMKITSSQMHTYTQKQRIPTLQELADTFCEDEEIEYVVLESKAVASLNKITVGDKKSIFTKMKNYPYEFEINSQLQLASIDGIAVQSNESTFALTQEQYSSILNRLTSLESNSTINNYSTNEQVVGTWIDGKPIYRKTITITTTNNTLYRFNAKNVLSQDIDVILKTYGYSLVDNGTVYANFPCYYTTQAYLGSWYTITTNEVSIIAGNQYASATHYLSFEYTKTTDTATPNN